jgi:inward rectifier potassium channel
MPRSPKTVSTRSNQVEFVKVNIDHQWRDVYQWVLALSWTRFIIFISSAYIAINLIFATLYSLGGDSVAGMRSGSFLEGFFFSIQTLATVGYGHMYPQTAYGHVVATIEIVSGMFWLAVMTGLIFVRFSRPTARIVFSKCLVIAPFNGQPTLMLRVANLRSQSMVETEFRVMFMRDEPLQEDGEMFRHFYSLKLHFERLIVFPAALTLRHTIDQTSPLYGETPESLETSRALFVASVVGVETVIPAAVQCQKDYSWQDVRFGQRFVDVYTDDGDGRLTVDYGRLDETRPIPKASESTENRVGKPIYREAREAQADP